MVYTVVYSASMFTVVQSKTFRDWFTGLRDENAKTRIVTRLDRVGLGNLGDWRSLGGGVSELRIPYGPGYRLYFTRRGEIVILLLCGGDKRTQAADIRRAVQMVKALED
jgi:putative addiction module killer protein